MKRAFLLLATAPLFLASSCPTLVEDGNSDLYLSPDGSVEWMMFHQNVRSTAGTPDARLEEEAAAFDALESGEDQFARGLEVIGARDVRNLILRDRVPFVVLTSARFDAVDGLFQGLFGAAGVSYDVRLESGVMVEDQSSGVDILCNRLLIRHHGEADFDLDSPVAAIIFAMDGARINLVEGRFVAAKGFKITSARQATMSWETSDGETKEDDEDGETLLWLAWTVEE